MCIGKEMEKHARHDDDDVLGADNFSQLLALSVYSERCAVGQVLGKKKFVFPPPPVRNAMSSGQ